MRERDRDFVGFVLSAVAFDRAGEQPDTRECEVMYVGRKNEKQIAHWLRGSGISAQKVADRLFLFVGQMHDLRPVLCQTKKQVFSRRGCAARHSGPAVFTLMQYDLNSHGVPTSWPISGAADRDDGVEFDPDDYQDGGSNDG